MNRPYDREAAKSKKQAKQVRDAKAKLKHRLLLQLRLAPRYYEYTERIRKNHMWLEKFLDRPSCSFSDEVKQQLRREMLKSDAPFLAANNPEGRILFYPAWVANLLSFVGEQKAQLVTLVPRQYVFPISLAASFDFRVLQAWAREELRGFDFVGMVEVAHYSQAFAGVKTEAQVSFHVHIIVVGANAKALKERVAHINSRFKSLLPDCPVADVRTIKPMDLQIVAGYMAKEANIDYRVYPMKEQLDDELAARAAKTSSGEVKARQAKKRLTSGVQYRLRNVTRGMHLDHMVFGGGSGADAVRKIQYDARRTLPHSKRRGGRELIHSGCFEPREDAPVIDRFKGWLAPMRGYQAGDYIPEKLEVVEPVFEHDQDEHQVTVVKHPSLLRAEAFMASFDDLVD